MQVKVFIGLGSNLENPIQQIKIARSNIEKLAGIKINKVSSLYRSIPLGALKQPDFINAVIEIQTTLTAEELLENLLTLEEKQGRKRNMRWGPRTIDLDILLYGMQIIQTDRLTIPHVEIKNREFVLFPLYEIAPNLHLPTGERIVDLCAQCDRRIERLEELSDAHK